jgi:hypothetical protein
MADDQQPSDSTRCCKHSKTARYCDECSGPSLITEQATTTRKAA